MQTSQQSRLWVARNAQNGAKSIGKTLEARARKVPAPELIRDIAPRLMKRGNLTQPSSYKFLESIGDIEPFCSMSYEGFVDHFLPLVNLDPTKAVEVAAKRIATKFPKMPAPLAGALASSLAMLAASETSRYAEEVMLRMKRQLERG